ncbi:putative protein isoform X2 [Capsicum galapagoense]
MAAENERRLRKRKRKADRGRHRKLDVDQKVEVRSVEDGFLGSWHSGVVIRCDYLIRHVEYDHIVSDKGSGNLVELISVSPIVDGVIPAADEKLVHNLGFIRPLPPQREFGRWPLPYGQCVDFYYQDAWWEGVIFDREEGEEERRIFFPEMGDEMKAQVSKLRLSQDWDEVTEEWEPRGSWIFLEVVEEIEKANPLVISVKQIWYDVQLKDEFDENLKLWTSSSTDIWRKLVKEVVYENTKLTIKQFFAELNCSEVFVEGGQLLEFSELAFEAERDLQKYFDNSIAAVTEAACKLDSAATLHMDQDCSHLLLPMDQDISNLQPLEKQFVSEDFAPAMEDVQLCGNDDCEPIPPSQKEDLSVLPPPSDGTGILSSTNIEPPPIANSKPWRGKSSTKKKKIKGQTVVGEPDSFPEATSTKAFKKPPTDDIADIMDQDVSDLQPVEKKFVSEDFAPAMEDVQWCSNDDCELIPPSQKEDSSVLAPPSDGTGIFSSTNSEPPPIANSKPRRGRPPTKRKKTEGQTIVSEPDSCPETGGLQLPMDQVGSHHQPVEKQIFSENFAPATDDVQLCGNDDCESIPPSQKEDSSLSPHDLSVLPPPSDGTGILSSTSSELPPIPISNLRRGRPPTKKRKISKPLHDDTAGILSSSKSELPTLTNSKPCRGRPPTKKKKFEGQTLVGELDSCPEATANKESDDIVVILSSDKSDKSEPPTSANSRHRRGRLPKKKKKFDWQTRAGEPNPCLAKRMPSFSSKREFKKHLLMSGWKFEVKWESGKIKKLYIAPNGNVCESISQACRVLEESKARALVSPVEQSSLNGDTDNSIQSACMERPQPCNELPELPYPSEEIIIEPEICREAVIDYCSPKSQDVSAYQKSYRHGVKISATALKAKKHLAATGWKFYSVGKKDKKLCCYRSPEGKSFISFRKACKWCVKMWEAESHVPERVSSPSTATQNSCERLSMEEPLISLLTKPRNKRKSRPSLRKGDGDMRSGKRARSVAPSSSNQTPRTVLSWLIDNNVVLPRAKVVYCRKKCGNPIAEGRITREGIKCYCCQKIYGLHNFEAHTGNSCNIPSANIYLEDGRSLLECQMQMKDELSVQNKEDSCFTTNDYICSVCHYGGDLILCDGCPSSFHPDCLGIKEVPDGDWFCPSCCCKVCGEGRFDTNKDHFTDNSVLICCQCDLKYHARCLRSKGTEELDNFPEGNWFCSTRCELIFLGMHHLLEKSVIVGDDDLTWTLLKYTKADDSESSAEIYSRLRVALNVMHECFEPVEELLTGRDITKDVIFSRWSELNRLNFKGFYTVLLERNDELITVAVVRVYGEKVAELPLVATQFKYRRLGMCRILMKELEKKLVELGVERLVLPAVRDVLNTWTTKFGFSVVERSERADFFDYTLLDFQGTVLCQKILQKTPAAAQQTHFDNTNSNDNVESDENVAVSEVLQATQVEGCATADQGPVG